MISPGDARVLMIGAGGLGTPALLMLASRGVRRIGILDPDRVELSNLHRQILYREEDVGQPKAECAARALRERFSNLEIETMPEAFESSTHDVVSRYDIVLDGTDLFETKLAISDACIDRGVDVVYAAVVAYEGQVLATRPGRSACMRCLFDEAPPPGAAPSCAEVGVLGPIAGIVAAHQAAATLALLRGDAEPLDRIWIYDGRRDRARCVRLRRAPDCKGCGAGIRLRRAMHDERPSSLETAAAVVDLSGLVCPSTYIETRKALERLPERARLWIHLTSDEAARNVPRGAIAAGHRVLAQLTDGRTHRLLLERGSNEPFVIDASLDRFGGTQ
jgi:adenylyltransferase/sulfurtransferase